MRICESRRRNLYWPILPAMAKTDHLESLLHGRRSTRIRLAWPAFCLPP